MGTFQEAVERAEVAEAENEELQDQITALRATVQPSQVPPVSLAPRMFPASGRRRRRGRQRKPPRTTRHEQRYTSRIVTIVESVQENIQEELFDQLDGIVAEHAADTAVVPVLVLDDAHDRISRIFGQITVFAEQLLPDARLRNAADRTANEVNATNKDFNSENVRSVLGVDVFTTEPWLIPEQEAFTKENASLIKGISEEEVSDIEQLVFRMVRAGDSPGTIRDAIQEVMAASKSRAQLIGRDQVSKFNARLTQQRQAQLGVTEYIWRTSDDERVRPSHQALDDTVQKWSEPPVTVVSGKRAGARNHPGQDIQCVPGDSKVMRLHGAAKFFRREYTGKLATLITEDGASIRATPHHPILTGRGWLAFDSVKIGEEIFKASDKSDFGREHGVHQTESRIADVFDALTEVFPPSVRETGIASQFHGDGTDQEVNVIDTDSCLADVLDPAIDQDICQEILAWADETVPDVFLGQTRSFQLVCEALWPTPDGIVRGACKLFALFRSELSHARKHRSAAISRINILLQKIPPNDRPTDSVFFGNGLLTDPGEIIMDNRLGIEVLSIVRRVALADRRIDIPSAEELAESITVAADNTSSILDRVAIAYQPLRVVDKFSRDHDGPVFNVETSTGWFIADRTVIHNCRCIAEAVFPNETS